MRLRTAKMTVANGSPPCVERSIESSPLTIAGLTAFRMLLYSVYFDRCLEQNRQRASRFFDFAAHYCPNFYDELEVLNRSVTSNNSFKINQKHTLIRSDTTDPGEIYQEKCYRARTDPNVRDIKQFL